jgi:hypothetical protein
MALPVSGGYLPLTAEAVEEQAKTYPHMRLLNNGHFWPPTPSRPGETALGKQLGDAPGWQLPSYGAGNFTSPGTVANFSAACVSTADRRRPQQQPSLFAPAHRVMVGVRAYIMICSTYQHIFVRAQWFMGVTLADYADKATPIGLISTDAGGTSIHRWVSQAAAAKCSQVTPTSPASMGADIGTLFDPMVLPLARMAINGFTWYQGEANECPTKQPVRMAGPCGGKYYACQVRDANWRSIHIVCGRHD